MSKHTRLTNTTDRLRNTIGLVQCTIATARAKISKVHENNIAYQE